MACHKQGLTCWRGGRGRSGLVSLETWRDLCVAGTSVKLSCKKKSTTFHMTWTTRRDVVWQWNKCPSINNSTSFHLCLLTLFFVFPELSKHTISEVSYTCGVLHRCINFSRSKYMCTQYVVYVSTMNLCRCVQFL